MLTTAMPGWAPADRLRRRHPRRQLPTVAAALPALEAAAFVLLGGGARWCRVLSSLVLRWVMAGIAAPPARAQRQASVTASATG